MMSALARSDTSPLSIGIIGAGIVGVSCGLHLQRAGHQVEVIDWRGAGEGASSGNAGIIAVSELIPFSTFATLRKVPAMLRDPNGPLRLRRDYLLPILPWLARFTLACRPSKQEAIVAALSNILSRSWDAWSAFATDPAVAALIKRVGWLQVFEDSDGVRKKTATVALQRARGIAVQEVSSKEIQDMEPALAPVFGAGLYYPDNGLVSSPLKMVRALSEMLFRDGATYHRERAVAIATLPGGEIEVRTTGETRRYDRVVLAAGAHSRSLLRTLKLDVPLDTERGYHLMLPRPGLSLRRSVSFSDYGFSLGPIDDAIRLTSGVEFAGLEAEPDWSPIRHMVTHAQRFLPGLSSDISDQWLGFRPSLPDSLPVIGSPRKHPGVILAFGHGHLGLTTGPLTGSLVAATVARAPLPFDIEPLSPSRWGI